MKKSVVLIVLFALPIVAYLFFASGVNSFARLPVLTPGLYELPAWPSLSGDRILLSEKITIFGFPGSNLTHNKGNAFNLNQKIYEKNKDFKDFQVVMLVPEGSQSQAKQLAEELGRLTDLKNWHYVFAPAKDIKKFYASLKLQGSLDSNLGTPDVYIIDKDRSLRGRKGANKKGEQEYKEGYNTTSPADLHNEMADDVKVILAEYRLALKKNNKRKI